LTTRPGWTRVELVVALLATMTAAGLVATVLLQSRAPAQRVECTMHMQLLGAAVLAFHDEKKTLPASCIAPSYATWAVQIAPFLQRDQSKALLPWDPGLPYKDQPAAVREGQVWVYYCPARRSPGHVSQSGDIVPGALGDYGCAPTSDNKAFPWTSPQADGALIPAAVLEQQNDKIIRWQSRTSLAMLARGVQNTILLGEKHVPLGGFGQAQFGDGSIYNGGLTDSFARLIDSSHALAQGPADPFHTNFGSWHPGLCQFLMADGSVRPFANDVSPKLLQELVPRGVAEIPE
jgi:prepilin-type processing-associated H-X9-DG protein